MTRVALVSTSPAVRAGLRALLASAGDVVIVAESPTLQVGILEALDVPPDVVVLDAPSASSLDDLTDWMDGVDVGLLVLGPADGLDRLLASAPAFAWGYLAREQRPGRTRGGY